MRDICGDLQERLDSIEVELTPLRARVNQLEADRSAIKRLLWSESGGALGTEPGSLRPGTEIEKVRNAILEAGNPLHIDEIMDRIGVPCEHKLSIVSSIAKYVKRQKIFTRTAPNTFGLLE